MKRLIPLLFACLLASAALAANWPRFGGASNVPCTSAEIGINKTWKTTPPSVLWQVGMGDNGYSGPAVADGRIFIVDHDGANDLVRCISLKDAHEYWRKSYPDAEHPINGYGFARATPAVDGEKVYTCSGMGKLICWKTSNGEKVWEKSLTADFGGKMPQWGYAASPFVDGNKLIVVTGGDNIIHALNKDTGDELWKGGGAEMAGYATPVKATILGTPQYVIFGGQKLLGLNTETGAQLWHFDWRTGCDVNAAQPIVGGNFIFITSAYNHGCAFLEITKDGPVVKWQNGNIQSHFQTPVVAGGYIYGKNDFRDPGAIVCVEAKSGDVMWKKVGFTKGGMVAVDGTLIITSGKSGETVQFEQTPTAYTELGRMHFLDTPEQCWVAPILADGHLLVRTVDHLTCLYITKHP